MQLECFICMESRRENDIENKWCGLIPCGHVYHQSCIDQWKAQRRDRGIAVTCPVCRHPFQNYQLLYGRISEPNYADPVDNHQDGGERFSSRESYDELLQSHQDTVEDLRFEQLRVEELEMKLRDTMIRLELIQKMVQDF